MTPRHAFRWFLWASCALAAMLCTGTARADGPMCDDRGMSVNAPPPVMPIRDARIERGNAATCLGRMMAVDARHRVQREGRVIDPPSIDAWVEIDERPVLRVIPSNVLRWETGGLMRSPAHVAGVFRPPRRA